jgi:hypothetical protein
MSTAEREYIRAGDVARIFKVSPKTVARWSTEGTISLGGRRVILPCMYTLGGHRRYDRAAMLRLAQELSTLAKQEPGLVAAATRSPRGGKTR